MKPKILLVQFRINPTAVEQERVSIQREVGDTCEVGFVSALDKEIDWNFPEVLMEEYTGVVLGGSGDLDFDGGRPADDEVRRISY